MASLTVNFTDAFLKQIGFLNIDDTVNTNPTGVWVDAVTFDSNGTQVCAAGSKGVTNILGNYGIAPHASYCATSHTLKATIIPNLSSAVFCGAVTYIVVSGTKYCSNMQQSPVYAFNKCGRSSIGPQCGYISCQTQEHKNNFQYGQFEWTVKGNKCDTGDLTAINNFSLAMGVTAVNCKAGYNVTANNVFSIFCSNKASGSTTLFNFNCSNATLQGKPSFSVTPTSAQASGKSLNTCAPFSPKDWCGYLSALSEPANYAKVHISGTYNGAGTVVPAVGCVSQPYKVYHNPGYFDYSLQYACVGGASAFVLSPSSSSVVKGYIVIPQNSPGCWNGGLANSIYSTLGNAQVYALCPVHNAPGACNPAYTFPTVSRGGVTTTNYFNVGANSQWGKVFTQFLTGLASGYLGQTGCLSQFNSSCSGSVCLSKSYNWCPSYAFGNNQKPTFAPNAKQTFDPIAKYFFNNTNVYGDMYQDNIMSKYSAGGPLVKLYCAAKSAPKCINLTVYGNCEAPGCYTPRQICNTYKGSVGSPCHSTAPSSTQRLTFNFADINTASGAATLSADPSKFSMQVRVYCNAGGVWSCWSKVTSQGPSVKVTFNAYGACNVPGAVKCYPVNFVGNCANKSTYQLTSSAITFQCSGSNPAKCQYTYKCVSVSLKCGSKQAAQCAQFSVVPYGARCVVFTGCHQGCFPTAPKGYGFVVMQEAASASGSCATYGVAKVSVNSSTVTLCVNIRGNGSGGILPLNCSKNPGAAIIFKDGYGDTFAAKTATCTNPGSGFAGIKTVQFEAVNVSCASAIATYQAMMNCQSICISKKMLSNCGAQTNLTAYVSPYVVSSHVDTNASPWNLYKATYCSTKHQFNIQQCSSTKQVGNISICLPASTCQSPLHYQFDVKNTATGVDKIFNVYQRNSGVDFVDGGATPVPGYKPCGAPIYKQQTINVFNGGCLSYQPCLVTLSTSQCSPTYFVAGQASAPVIGRQTNTKYCFLGKCAPIASIGGQAINANTDVHISCGNGRGTGYVFGWAGFNPQSTQAPYPICGYTNKVMPNDLVAIHITSANVNKYIFAQADIDGMWLTGNNFQVGSTQLCGSAYIFPAQGKYCISFQEYRPCCAAHLKVLAQGGATCVKPVGQASYTLTVCYP